MAIISINKNRTASVSIQLGDRIFTYNLKPGYKLKSLTYEENGGTKEISGKITDIDPDKRTLTVEDTVTIDPMNISRIGNNPDSIINVLAFGLTPDTDFGGSTMEGEGYPNADVTMVIGADPMIIPEGEKPEQKYPDPDDPDNDPEKPDIPEDPDPLKPDNPEYPPYKPEPEPEDPDNPTPPPDDDDPDIPDKKDEDDEPLPKPPFFGPDEKIDMDDYVPIVSEHKDLKHTVIYDQYIQKVSYIQANITAIFREWFLSFFRPDYFRHIRIKTESTYTKFKSFMKDIYKKEYPLLVIDPNSPEHVEDFIFGTNVINRYQLMDPGYENIGAKMLYSIPIIETDRINLVYRRDRFRFKYDVLLMERTLDRAIDLHNYLLMNMRHQSQFMLFRKMLNLIPTHMIRSVAKINGFEEPTDECLDWLNAHAMGCTILRRTLPNGQTLYFAEMDVHIQVEVPDIPAKDSPELSDAIEIAARVTDTFTFTVDIPSEFMCVMDTSVVRQYERYEEGDDPEIHYITSTPAGANMDIPHEIGDYIIFNRADVMIQHAEDNTMDLTDIVKDIDKNIYTVIQTMLYDNDVQFDEPLFKVTIVANNRDYSNYDLSNKGILTINNPDYSTLYRIFVYLNYKMVNLYNTVATTKFIGDIQHTPY